MKKYSTFLLVVVVALTSCASAKYNKKVPTKSFVQVIRNLSTEFCPQQNKCKIVKSSAVGSGVVFLSSKKENKSYILTASHVCFEKPSQENIDKINSYTFEIYVRNHENEIKEARVTLINADIPKEPDLCILEVHDLFLPRVAFSMKKPRIGETVYSMSAPGGVYHPPVVPIFSGIYSGEIPSELGNESFPSSALITIPSIGGSSGSAVLNKDMEIVGIIFASAMVMKNISLITKHKDTLNFVKLFKNKLGIKNPIF